ncbi:hypothetical protein DICPUDRAFT_154243 [Dictyostelium purpureum]|uniref:Uncharacterized protein n=1 Tax=Dictyostelium purpureum TaxID=5786 RepID=F0ZQU2_DICPU|nr:uncharacterized protein DICPUDRAFT_154243 [Dictyostelium purpureum]EGC33667.1 hypothetical protein DICPUDRAFT_154243 [Dictyostelium purpureum]|eukprot:XP_003289786.1 hypothetical protein DICPUDRAFT_154243 [Dictyostelium purpureum]
MEYYLLETAVLFVVFICFYFYFGTKDNTNKGTDRDDSPKQHNSVPQNQNDNKTWAQSQPPFSGPNLNNISFPPSNPRPTPQQTVQPTPKPTSRARARSKQTPTLLFSLPSPQPTPRTRSKPRPKPQPTIVPRSTTIHF